MIPRIEPLRSHVAREAQPQRIAARVALGIGAVELGLATVGLYGMLLFALLARTRELGLRLALGAAPRQASWAVLRGGLRLAALGRGGLRLAALGGACGLLIGVPAIIISP